MLNVKKLIEVRKGLGFSQQELADEVSVTLMTIHRYEHGGTTKLETIKRMVDVFNKGRTVGPFVCKSITKYNVDYFLK